MKPFRNIPGDQVQDPSSIASIEYNKYSGSQKVSEVGRRLKPLVYISGSTAAYSTDASSAARIVDNGACLAIYNNSSSVAAITVGESNAVVALAAGVTDSAGHVGVPCMPNAWTYVAVGTHPWIKTSSSSLMVFVIEDASTISQEFIQPAPIQLPSGGE